jgi:hypothetical protein
MKNFKNVVLAVSAVCSFAASAQTLPAGLPTPPEVNVVCAQAAENYGKIFAYLMSVSIYEHETLVPLIRGVTDHAQWDYAVGEYLGANRQVQSFLKACFVSAGFSVPADFCTGNYTPSAMTPAQLASWIDALDISQGDLTIQGFASIPAPPANFKAPDALQAFYTNTMGEFCTIYEYALHPVEVSGLKFPKF